MPVSPGQTLTGTISLVSQDGTEFSYTAEFANIDGTALAVDGAEELAWATETLEAYSVTAATDYPVGTTVLSGISLVLADGGVPAMGWSIADDNADAISTIIDVDGAVDAQLTITY